jgi:hypothetical protein
MPIKTKIKSLVDEALSLKKNEGTVVIGVVSKKQAIEIMKLTGVETEGCERIMDTQYIRHSIRNHGHVKTEKSRGQIAISLDDFELVPDIISNPDTIKYLGKNSLKQDVIEYKKRINDLYFVVEAVRVAKRGNTLVFNTIYKRK